MTMTSARSAQGSWIAKPRRRQAGADALERGQRTLALRLPQRLRERILRRQRIGERGRRAMADAGAAVEAAKRLFAGRPAETNQGNQRAERQQRKQDRGRSRARPTAAPATIRPMRRSGTGRQPSSAGPDAARSRSQAIAYCARCRACVSFRRATSSGSRAGFDESVLMSFNNISGLPASELSTTAAMGHPFQHGIPPLIPHNTKA